ncbi:SdpI family protein [Leifsonia shinshuensis]
MTSLDILIAILAIVAGAAVQLAARGRLPRNGIIGIRTASVRRDDSTWVRGHRAAVVPTWVTVFVVVTLAAVSIARDDASSVVLTSVAVAVILAGAFVSSVFAGRAARRPPHR